MKTLRNEFTPRTTAPTRFDAISHAVEKLAKKSDPHAALTLLTSYIEEMDSDTLLTDSQKIKLLMTFTKLLCEEKRFAEALPYSARICSMAPEDVKGWTRHAFILKHMGEFQTAEMLYRMAIEHYPDDTILRTSLGDLYEMTADIKQAIDLYQSVLDINGQDRVAARRLMSLRHG